MGLRQWSPSDPVPALRTGFVLFDTSAQPGLPRVYHAMLVRSGDTRPARDGARVSVADMTLDGIRFGEKPPVAWRLNPSCYIGSLDELEATEHARVIGALMTLRPPPSASGGAIGIYCLSGHAIYKTDPNNPRKSTFHCSCASLVEWCFQQLDYDLVREETLCVYDAQLVRASFCPEMDLSDVKEALIEWGLDPEGSWSLLLPANQMRAFHLALANLPHNATTGDHPYL